MGMKGTTRGLKEGRSAGVLTRGNAQGSARLENFSTFPSADIAAGEDTRAPSVSLQAGPTRIGALFIVLLVTCLGCRSVYYSTWEKFGKYKRDLLQSKVKQVRDDQKETTEQLKDALTRLQELYGFKGGDLEKMYRRLQGDYDDSVAKAAALKKRIGEMDQIANDMFKEWEKEDASISTPSLREQSQQQLRDTQRRYQELYSATTRAEGSIEPVLTKFHDYVLFFKHNLNAQAIGALQGEASKIQVDISKLIQDMNESIAQAEKFMKENQK